MIIYSKLPRSLDFIVGDEVVTIHGNQIDTRSQLPDHGRTEITESVWEALSTRYKKHPAIKKGHIFVAKNDKEATARAHEMASEKTGLEQLDPAKVPGIQKNDDDSVRQQARK